MIQQNQQFTIFCAIWRTISNILSIINFITVISKCRSKLIKFLIFQSVATPLKLGNPLRHRVLRKDLLTCAAALTTLQFHFFSTVISTFPSHHLHQNIENNFSPNQFWLFIEFVQKSSIKRKDKTISIHFIARCYICFWRPQEIFNSFSKENCCVTAFFSGFRKILNNTKYASNAEKLVQKNSLLVFVFSKKIWKQEIRRWNFIFLNFPDIWKKIKTLQTKTKHS